MPPTSPPIEIVVSDDDQGTRLDVFLADRLPQYSRVKLRRMIGAGCVTLDGRRSKAAQRIKSGQRVRAELVELAVDAPQPENLPLDVLFEDESLVAINKPAGMVVHPSKGHWSGTLTAALAYHFQNLSTVGGPTRPGIVHRLDRDTSGVLIVAKSDEAHLRLAEQFEQRTVTKQYFAIVSPAPDRDADVIDAPIGVHPYQRERMAIRAEHRTSRDAETFYQVQQRFDGFAALDVHPKTGRTHQIRLHLAHVGSPVLCDRLYSGRARLTRAELGCGERQQVLLERQALHAQRIRLAHPLKSSELDIWCPLPGDLRRTIDVLRSCRGSV